MTRVSSHPAGNMQHKNASISLSIHLKTARSTILLTMAAKINNKTFICLLFVFVLVGVIMTTTEARVARPVSSGGTITFPICSSVIGVKSGDTCFDIAQKFKLSTSFFNSINPNLNCDALFVGEWICIDGI
ncbi:hypothetical protein SSX86_027433 [Deinandra increscens subsp. villosa]|uniref:LysM domain-containing protein n=1 Tax=Deinandra increscens subsp. villosa TaxID=3103831 RepID=A0AAP0CK22_9ASTR